MILSQTVIATPACVSITSSVTDPDWIPTLKIGHGKEKAALSLDMTDHGKRSKEKIIGD